MRSLVNAVKTGFAEIWAHKTRSVLSFLAIAAGSVVFIDAFAAIFDTYDRLQKQKEVSGMARMKISPNYSQTYSSPDEYIRPPVITYDDVVRLRERIPGLYMVSPEGRAWRTILQYNGQRVLASATGVTPEWAKRDFVYTLRGRFIDWNDINDKLRVCLLVRKAPPAPTSNFMKTLMKKYDWNGNFDNMVAHNDMLGKTVLIGGITFTVIGILEELPYSRRPNIIGNYSQDYKMLMPITTANHYDFINSQTSLDVSIDTGSEKNFEESMRLVRNFLKIRFGDEESFIIENRLELIRERIADSVKASLVTISLGMLAFLAGGIGIMNVTLATVFARTKEIGIRRAIGARRRDIMLQFMVEAVMLGLIGGVLGSVLGYLWGVPIKVMLGMGGSPIKIWMPFLAVLIAAFTAFVFAIYPAWVAAGLKPADALRTE